MQVLSELVVPEGPTLYPTEAYTPLKVPADHVDVTEEHPVARARAAAASTSGERNVTLLMMMGLIFPASCLTSDI